MKIEIPESSLPSSISYRDLTFNSNMVYRVIVSSENTLAVWSNIGGDMIFFSEDSIEVMTEQLLLDDDYASLRFIETSLELQVSFKPKKPE